MTSLNNVIHTRGCYDVRVAPTNDKTLNVGTMVYHIRNNDTGVDEFESKLGWWAILLCNEIEETYRTMNREETIYDYLDRLRAESGLKHTINESFLQPIDKKKGDMH